MAPRRASRTVPLLLALLACTGPADRAAPTPSPSPSASPSGSASASPSASPTPSATPSPPSCRGHEGLRVEVDGDPRPDVAFVSEIGGDMTAGVCTGAGRYATLHVAGMGELFHAADVDRDGRDELFAGGTWASGGGVDLIRYVGGRLRFVTGPGGERFWLRFELNPDAQEGTAGWGCPPDRRELVQVTVDWRRRVVRTETFALRGLRAVRTSATTGRAPAGAPDGEYANRVAGGCPELR